MILFQKLLCTSIPCVVIYIIFFSPRGSDFQRAQGHIFKSAQLPCRYLNKGQIFKSAQYLSTPSVMLMDRFWRELSSEIGEFLRKSSHLFWCLTKSWTLSKILKFSLLPFVLPSHNIIYLCCFIRENKQRHYSSFVWVCETLLPSPLSLCVPLSYHI